MKSRLQRGFFIPSLEVEPQSPQTFGVITTQGNDPRAIQLGLRFNF